MNTDVYGLCDPGAGIKIKHQKSFSFRCKNADICEAIDCYSLRGYLVPTRLPSYGDRVLATQEDMDPLRRLHLHLAGATRVVFRGSLCDLCSRSGYVRCLTATADLQLTTVTTLRRRR